MNFLTTVRFALLKTLTWETLTYTNMANSFIFFSKYPHAFRWPFSRGIQTWLDRLKYNTILQSVIPVFPLGICSGEKISRVACKKLYSSARDSTSCFQSRNWLFVLCRGDCFKMGQPESLIIGKVLRCVWTAVC